MRVLIVDEEFPYPPDSGKRLRTWNLIKRLGERHEIVYFARENNNNTLDCPGIEFICLNEPVTKQRGLRFYSELLINMASPFPYVVTRHSSPTFRDAVDSIINSRHFDLIHCEWTPYAKDILHLAGKIPLMLMTHNVESLIWRRSFSAECNPAKKAYIGLQWLKMERFEKRACRLFDEVSCVSENDAKLMTDHFGCERVSVVPNGVDPDYFHPVDMPSSSPSMVFTGSMDWRPNQDGMNWFIKEVWPIVRASRPDATLDIVGRNPPADMVAHWTSHKGITVSGTVPDVRPHVAQAAIYITPLRVGGGSRLKILEALAMGKPVVSTTIGAEGLLLKDGEHLLLRDTPGEFANQLLKIMATPRGFTDMARRGRERVLSEYGWDGIAPRLESAWMRIVDRFALLSRASCPASAGESYGRG